MAVIDFGSEERSLSRRKYMRGRLFFFGQEGRSPVLKAMHILIIGQGTAGCKKAGEADMTGFPMVSYREFDRLMEAGRIRQLVDLREAWKFEHERIRGSINIPFCELECRLGEIERAGTVVFYCDRGAKSMFVCRDLWRMGYTVVDLAGGMLNYRGKYIDRRPLGDLE